MSRERRLFAEGYREMKSEAVSGLMLILLLISMLTLAFNITPVSGVIEIPLVLIDEGHSEWLVSGNMHACICACIVIEDLM